MRTLFRIKPPFFSLLHTLPRASTSRTAASDSTQPNSISINRNPPPTLPELDFAMWQSQHINTSQFQTKWSREASRTSRHYLRKCHPKTLGLRKRRRKECRAERSLYVDCSYRRRRRVENVELGVMGQWDWRSDIR